MNQKIKTFFTLLFFLGIIITSLYFSFKASWIIFFNALIVYLTMFMLQLQTLSLILRSDELTNWALQLNSALSESGEVEFETTPFSFIQQQQYEIISGNKDRVNPEEYFNLVLTFLKSRAKNKDIHFENFPADTISLLVEKAYKSAKNNKNSDFENADDIF